MRFSDRKDILKTKNVILISGVALLIILSVFAYLIWGKVRFIYYEATEFTMGTRIRVYISSDEMNPKDLANMVLREFERIDQKFDPYNPESVIYKINHSNDWVDVDKETFALIEAAVGYAKLTEGAFDPALGRIITLWGFDDFSSKNASSLTVPQEKEIKKALQMSGYQNIVLDRENMRIKMLNGAQLDLGAIVKGYALEKSYNIVKSIDKDATGFIDAGGEIKIIGPKYGKTFWVIGIKNPRGTGSIDYIYMKEGSIATSGDYERYFIVDGKRYHHIIDPQTGWPASYARSVTVIARDAVAADVLSTAGFVMAKDWRYVVVHFPELGAQVFMVLSDGSIKKSEGFLAYERKP
ncbi:MAG: FAD:protein FMN transferase [Thermotogaceae bacterium]|nr:FAD:protein FMN transferase [Thermotogaceae bacterium]